MDVFNFCWVTLLEESKKCSVLFDKNTCKVKNDYDEEFEKPIKRVSYLYKYGSFNVCFFKHCFIDFISNVPHALKIVDKMCSTENLNICSLSTGPGTYIIGLLYSLHLLGKSLKGSVNFRIVSKHGAWRNVVHQMLNSQIANVPESSTCKLIQCDILTKLNSKTQTYIKNADVLLLCGTFSSRRANKDVVCRVIKDILQLLKPGALVFFICSKEKSYYLGDLYMFGSFLYEPIEMTMENMPYDKRISKCVEVEPSCSGSSYFAVWQKSDNVSNEALNKLKEKQNIKIVDSPIANISAVEKDSSSITKSPTSFGSTIMSKLNQFKSNLNENNISFISTECSASDKSECLKVKAKYIDVKDISISTSSSDTNLSSCNNNKSCTRPNSKPSTSNQKMVSFEGHSTNESGNTLNSLLKRFENLVSNLEEFVHSQNMLESTQNKKKSCNPHHCACHLQSTHCGNVHKYQNFNESSSNQMPSPCARNHHMCYPSCAVMCSSNYHCQCKCSVYENQNKTQYQHAANQFPHIVIPLQNLSGNTLAQVLSLASQSRLSSSEKTH